MDFLSAKWDPHKLLGSLNTESMLPSYESLLRCSHTRSCARTSACMHWRVFFARRRTLWPLTKACSFTTPLRACRAFLAWRISLISSTPLSLQLSVLLKFSKSVMQNVFWNLFNLLLFETYFVGDLELWVCNFSASFYATKNKYVEAIKSHQIIQIRLLRSSRVCKEQNFSVKNMT